MKVLHVFESNAFEIFQTTALSQTAVMTLGPGESSSQDLNTHPKSDQSLIVLEGRLLAEVGSDTAQMGRGDVVTVPAGTPHRFANCFQEKAVTFSVYSPPAY